jgi:hypothetical protein
MPASTVRARSPMTVQEMMRKIVRRGGRRRWREARVDGGGGSGSDGGGVGKSVIVCGVVETTRPLRCNGDAATGY